MTETPIEAHQDDFTEQRYRSAVRLARSNYRFVPFGEAPDAPHVYWRHDVDLSPQRALALARIEAEEGVASTYFVMLHCDFYNALETQVVKAIREILGLGHLLGLHFDAGHAPCDDEERLAGALTWERGVLEHAYGVAVDAFSFHDPDVNGVLRFDQDVIAGMTNTYGRSLRDRYDYVSDSNGYWRYRSLFDVLEAHESPRLHVLTHPEWWQAVPMTPSARVDRCIAGRAARVRDAYDAKLRSANRVNVGAQR